MPMSMYEICVNSILVWQLSEANKGTKVEISASTEEEHNRRSPLSFYAGL